MEIEIESQDYIVRLADDDLYTRNSTDNKYRYDHEYCDETNPECGYRSKCGIRVFADDTCLESAILLSIGFSKLHSKSFVLSYGSIVVIVGKVAFSLSLPNLALNWCTPGDYSSCFGIYEFQGGYIVHGEQEVSLIRRDGTVAWQFTGRDIFASPHDGDVLQILDNKILITDWNGDQYILDSNGKLIK